MRLWRRGLRKLLGFDAIHALRNARRMRECDIVWTHTECQTLSVLALRKWHGAGPRVIGQSIWLFDDWPRLPAPLRSLHRWLLRDADVLTVHSPANLEVVRRLLPEVGVRSWCASASAPARRCRSACRTPPATRAA